MFLSDNKNETFWWYGENKLICMRIYNIMYALCYTIKLIVLDHNNSHKAAIPLYSHTLLWLQGNIHLSIWSYKVVLRA